MEKIEFLPECVMGFELVLQLLETLKKMKELLEKLIQQPAVVTYNNNIYHAPHLENHGPVTYNAPVNNCSSVAHDPVSTAAPVLLRKVPTFDVMMQVFKKMNSMGYWISKRSWGVGFQMWQIWGYKGTIQDFVKLVQNCPDMKMFTYECDENAVYKMMSKGHMSLHLDEWRSNGVLEPYCILGEGINDELLKLYPPEEAGTEKSEETYMF